MKVTCPQCGGPHPKWECHAKPAQIAAFKASKNRPAQEATLRGPAGSSAESDGGRPGRTKSKVSPRGEVAGGKTPLSTPATKKVGARPSLTTRETDGLAGPANAGDTRTANTKPAPKSKPRTAAQVKADMEAAIETIKKRGRPAKHPDRKAYRAEWMRKKRAEGKK